MIKIDKVRALELLEKAVEVKGPDHTDEACAYFSGDFGSASYVPSCIIGHCFAELGLTAEDLTAVVPSSLAYSLAELAGKRRRYDIPRLGLASLEGEETLLAKLGVELDDDAYVLWNTAQCVQDQRWDDAIAVGGEGHEEPDQFYNWASSSHTWGHAVKVAKAVIEGERNK